MKKQRSLDSREQNRYKQLRRHQRQAKSQIHRAHLRARLAQLHQALDTPLPADWAILFPELSEVLTYKDCLAAEWAVLDSAAPWFCRLSRQRGWRFSPKLERAASHFTLDMIILTHSILTRHE